MVGGETIAYAAPETGLFPERATSRRYDIWSLGCLYLEFVIWLLYGIEELERFGREISGRFYSIPDSAATLHVLGQKTAQVNPVVKKWIDCIKKDSRCAKKGSKETAIGRLIDLVETRLLVVTANPDPKDPMPTPGKPPKNDQARTNSGGQTDVTQFEIRLQAPTVLSDADPKAEISRRDRFANIGTEERAYAIEVYNKIVSIIQDVETGTIEWVNLDKDGMEPLSHSGPKSVPDDTAPSRRDSFGKNQEPLDDRWEYIADENAANQLRSHLKKLPPPTEPSELCSRCRELSLWSPDCKFNDSAANLEKSAVRCALCRLLSRSLMNWATLPDDNLNFFRFGSSIKFNNKRLPPIVSLYTLPGFETQEDRKWNIQLGFPKLPNSGSPSHIRVIREWIQDCNTHDCLHSDVQFLPTRLLDVGKHGSSVSQLVCDTGKLTKEDKYLALSHRWGCHPKPGQSDLLAGKIVCTYKENIDRLKQGIDDSDLPPMYQDAITIARELEVQYLWIDSLCIIQPNKDDPQDKGHDWKKESERMEWAFRCAYVTIAASCASSPAEHFLGIRPERQCVTMRKGSTPYYLCDVIDDFFVDVEQGDLNKRGWVLQERALSCRTIYFAKNQTYWECGEGVRCETLTRTKNAKASSLGDSNFPRYFLDHMKGMKIKLYQDLYERYSRLALSYPTDRPVAIRGLETRLLNTLESRGGYGVFDIYLRRGLMWKREVASLKRIDFSKDGNPVQISVPSWSWMAYLGPIRYMVPLEGADWGQWDRDVVSPWRKDRRGDKVSLELQVLVRDIAVLEPGTQAFLDDPNRTFYHNFKCVVVGSSIASDQGRGQTYYTLIVTPLPTEGDNIYERAGVAFLRKDQIMWDSPPIEARVR